MNYAEIKKLDVANGLGIRTSLFVSGCRNHCEGCFNACTWDFNFGKPFTKAVEDEILDSLAPSHVTGLSLLGGEPFEEENQEVLAPFLERVKGTYPQKNIWCWTGYVLDKDLLPDDGRKHTPYTQRMLDCFEFLVDGPFVLARKNIALPFRGSENQRIWQQTAGVWKVIEINP